MTVLNYTTKIAASKTVGEIQAMLATHGASRIATDYQDGGPSGLTFSLATAHGPKVFSLPWQDVTEATPNAFPLTVVTR
ncbi:hypothetical protein ACFVJS_03965 [Nocardioides sp. NPDC057772]|uniref:hypothetical protein n=1 Tax=Nocardioides sp. NPDC057772 TaxID=3346245 RepID=UPI00366B596E